MQTVRCDVAVIGGTPGGVAAALAASRAGAHVLLVEPSQHVGGLMTNGLGATDIEAVASIGGIFRRLMTMILDHYLATYGPDSAQASACRGGYHFEPSVAERCLEALLAERRTLTVWRGWRVAWEGGPSLRTGGRWVVETHAGAGPEQPDGVPEQRLVAVLLDQVDGAGRPTGERARVEAAAFVDATYEGDVAMGAGVPYRIGRESRFEFDEALAGKVYQDFRTKLCYPGSSGAADRRIQAYNYRLCLTDAAQNRVPVARPRGYDRGRYASLVADVRSGRIPTFAPPRGGTGLVVLVPMPNAKSCINHHHYAFCSTDLAEENLDYPEAGPERRRAIARAHREYVEGLLWFAQHDEQLPERFRAEALEWGYAADEFADNGHFPRQMYVREAARFVGDYTFASQDALLAADGGRTPVHWDSVGCGSYQIDSHATRKREDVGLGPAGPEASPDGRRFAVEGFLGNRPMTRPYQIPYRVMVPVGTDALLIPVAASSTHLGFGTIRMEPTWMALGEAAGTAAALAIRLGVRLRDVPRAALQTELLAHGQVITHFEDVPPASFPGADRAPPDLSPAVQFWGARGFFTTYQVEPDTPLTHGEAMRWCWLLERALDPWRTIPVEASTFRNSIPITYGAFGALLGAAGAIADPSPLRRSLGAPPAPPPPPPAQRDEVITRGDACRLLYRLYAPSV